MKPGDVVEVEIDGGIGVCEIRLWPRADPGPKPMKTILLRRPGGPSTLEYVDVPTPRPGEGEVLVKPTRSASVRGPETMDHLMGDRETLWGGRRGWQLRRCI
jgi:hypothetical protein